MIRVCEGGLGACPVPSYVERAAVLALVSVAAAAGVR